jgi:uncharacterized protein (DUF983 family)
MFRRWIVTIPVCSNCQFQFDRGEDDYYIGAYTLNLIVAELIVVSAMVVVIVTRWPDVPWKQMPWALAILAIGGPLFTYPFSKSVWLAIDLTFRPAETRDFTPLPTPDARL